MAMKDKCNKYRDNATPCNECPGPDQLECFEQKHITDFQKVYEQEISLFFQGRDTEIDRHPEGKGHVWIAGNDRQFQALTVEPLEGGQYEIAVRMPLECSNPSWIRDKYSGYVATKYGHLVGRNTDGH